MEITVFKKWTAPCFALVAVMTMLPMGAGAMTAEMCSRYANRCYSGCDARSIGKDVCIKRCVKAHSDCLMNATPASGHNGQAAQPAADPLTPKGGGVHTPPTGGAVDQPKSPPKVNDTRAPIGGGVFHPKTSASDTSGPILRSNGAGQPITKSNGGSGPTSKSGGGLR